MVNFPSFLPHTAILNGGTHLQDSLVSVRVRGAITGEAIGGIQKQVNVTVAIAVVAVARWLGLE